MQKTIWVTVATLLVGALYVGDSLMTTRAAEEEGPKIAHNVYFLLKDASPEAQKKLIDACNMYLTDHPGTLFFAAGTLADFDRPVNDRDWHVGLHVVFKDRQAHDQYQQAPRHLQFIEENKENWAKVRVFDTEYK